MRHVDAGPFGTRADLGEQGRRPARRARTTRKDRLDGVVGAAHLPFREIRGGGPPRPAPAARNCPGFRRTAKWLYTEEPWDFLGEREWGSRPWRPHALRGWTDPSPKRKRGSGAEDPRLHASEARIGHDTGNLGQRGFRPVPSVLEGQRAFSCARSGALRGHRTRSYSSARLPNGIPRQGCSSRSVNILTQFAFGIRCSRLATGRLTIVLRIVQQAHAGGAQQQRRRVREVTMARRADALPRTQAAEMVVRRPGSCTSCLEASLWPLLFAAAAQVEREVRLKNGSCKNSTSRWARGLGRGRSSSLPLPARRVELTHCLVPVEEA